MADSMQLKAAETLAPSTTDLAPYKTKSTEVAKMEQDAAAANNYNYVDDIPPTSGMPAADYSDVLYSKRGQKLQFYYVPSGPGGPLTVSFKAFLTQYSDVFTSDWKKDSVYGRMDPIATYGGTSRKIQIAWTIPAFSQREARVNMRKITTLIQMAYPVYDNHQGAGQISAAPLVKMKFGNLISNSNGHGFQAGGDVVSNGLLGWMDGVSFVPDLDVGFYDPGSGHFMPMSLSLSIGFNVLHQHRMGWKKTKEMGAGAGVQPLGQNTVGFPYGANSFARGGEFFRANEIITPKDLGKVNCDDGSNNPTSYLGTVTDPSCAQPKGADPINDAFDAVKEGILGVGDTMTKAFGGG